MMSDSNQISFEKIKSLYKNNPDKFYTVDEVCEIFGYNSNSVSSFFCRKRDKFFSRKRYVNGRRGKPANEYSLKKDSTSVLPPNVTILRISTDCTQNKNSFNESVRRVLLESITKKSQAIRLAKENDLVSIINNGEELVLIFTSCDNNIVTSAQKDGMDIAKEYELSIKCATENAKVVIQTDSGETFELE